MPDICSMKNCYTSKNDKSKKVYRFPLDPDRCKEWLQACGKPDLFLYSVEYLHRHFIVCELHFKFSDRVGDRLRHDAKPFPFDHNFKSTEDSATQTDFPMIPFCDPDSDFAVSEPKPSTASNTNKEVEMTALLKKTRLKVIQKLKTQGCENNLSFELLKLIELQNDIRKYKSKTLNSEKIDFFAMNVYLSCPTTYKTVNKSLNLPSVNLLHKTNLEIDAVMGRHVLASLKAKLNSRSHIDRHCVVCFKKMPLKRFLFYHINRDRIIGIHNINGKEKFAPATQVYVLMARGLKSKWEQLLAYCFVGDHDNGLELYSWIDFVLTKLIDMGYFVVALVIDHVDFYDVIRNNLTALTKPFITVNNTKIYCIFDLPQLIISLRNALMNHELQFDDDDGSLVIADWKIIESLYSGNDDGSRCIVSKLTKSHINPNESEIKELKYAAQVFSKSVSNALEIEAKRQGELNNRIRGTQKLTSLVNDVFDILNSTATGHHSTRKTAFSGEPNQMITIRKVMALLTSIKPSNDCVDVEDTLFNCLYGLRITLMSFTMILRDLWPKGIKSLVTCRFNLGALDKFFGSVKQNANSEKPTPLQFYKCFRKTFLNEIMECPKTVHRDDNLSSFIKLMTLKNVCRLEPKSIELKKTLEVETVDYRFELPTSNTFYYVCWYLLKKSHEQHRTCPILLRTLCENVLGVNWRKYSWQSYFKPPDVFIDFIKVLDEKFNRCFGDIMIAGLGTSPLMILRDIKFEGICPCFPVKYVKRLFVRLRIFHIIRYNNRRFRDESFRFSKTDHYNIEMLLN